MQDRFEIGKIVNTFGIKGEVKLTPYTDNVAKFKKIKNIYVENEEMEIEEAKLQNNFVILKLKAIDTMAQAEELRNKRVFIKRPEKELPEGEYYIADLIGLNVYTDEGELLGKVLDIYNTGANDIYEVETLEKKKVLLPAIKDVLKDINIAENKIVVHILKGLI